MEIHYNSSVQVNQTNFCSGSFFSNPNHYSKFCETNSTYLEMINNDQMDCSFNNGWMEETPCMAQYNQYQQMNAVRDFNFSEYLLSDCTADSCSTTPEYLDLFNNDYETCFPWTQDLKNSVLSDCQYRIGFDHKDEGYGSDSTPSPSCDELHLRTNLPSYSEHMMQQQQQHHQHQHHQAQQTDELWHQSMFHTPDPLNNPQSLIFNPEIVELNANNQSALSQESRSHQYSTYNQTNLPNNQQQAQQQQQQQQHMRLSHSGSAQSGLKTEPFVRSCSSSNMLSGGSIRYSNTTEAYLPNTDDFSYCRTELQEEADSVEKKVLLKQVLDYFAQLNSGASHIQLWQFLLELLSRPSMHHSCIRWEDKDKGEFRIVDPDELALKWGRRKKRPHMTYDKMGRALRYYYEKMILTKIAGKKSTYRFNVTGLICQGRRTLGSKIGHVF